MNYNLLLRLLFKTLSKISLWKVKYLSTAFSSVNLLHLVHVSYHFLGRCSARLQSVFVSHNGLTGIYKYRDTNITLGSARLGSLITVVSINTENLGCYWRAMSCIRRAARPLQFLVFQAPAIVSTINRVTTKDLRIKNTGVIREFNRRSSSVFRLWFKKLHVTNYKIFSRYENMATSSLKVTMQY